MCSHRQIKVLDSHVNEVIQGYQREWSSKKLLCSSNKALSIEKEPTNGNFR